MNWPHSAHSRYKDLPRGIVGPLGRWRMAVAHCGSKDTDIGGPRKTFLLLLFLCCLFHFVQLMFLLFFYFFKYIFSIFIYFFVVLCFFLSLFFFRLFLCVLFIYLLFLKINLFIYF